MKAIYQGKLYIVIENYHDYMEIASMSDDQAEFVSFSDPALIIDPTDGEIGEIDILQELP